jgi:DNA-binding NarL/FixJ family response regulator
MNKNKHITVLIADDHVIVREGLRKLLETEKDIEVIGEASTGRIAVELAGSLKPDVIVMDIAMPQMNGLEATRQIRKEMPLSKIIILSAHSDDAYVAGVMALGANGYLIKQSSAHVLSEAIREVQNGKLFYSPTISKRLNKRHLKSLDRNGMPNAKVAHLSSRELEILQRIAEGESNKEMASNLSISIKTVEKHRDHLMNKLDIHDTAGLTRYAIEVGIIESSVQVTIL